ncbi:MAG: hypothetical protein AB1805_04870 [Nitrospirota bacterium]
MNRWETGKRRSIDKELDFERRRLLNLIECRIRRNEVERARQHAEELFNTELEFELLRNTKRVVRYNGVLVNIIGFLMCVVLLLTAAAVLNIEPSFSLIAEAAVMLSIVFLLMVDSFIVRRFEKTLRRLMDKYEIDKQSFIYRTVDMFTK